LYKQHIDEEERYIIECTRCPELTLSPSEMGGHAVKVHQRSSFHVETRGVATPPVVEGLPWWGSLGSNEIAVPGPHYTCCDNPRWRGHALDCKA